MPIDLTFLPILIIVILLLLRSRLDAREEPAARKEEV